MRVDVKAPGCPATRRATGPSGTAWCRAGAARTPASYSVGQNNLREVWSCRIKEKDPSRDVCCL